MTIDDLEFSEFTIVNYDDAVELWNNSDGVDLTLGDSREAIEFYLMRNPGMSFKCTDKHNGIIAGTILCGHDGRRGFIYHLVVRAEYRNADIATKLIDLSLERLRSSDVQRCMIMVKDTNSKAKSFWEYSGWNTRDDLCMYSIDLNADSKTDT